MPRKSKKMPKRFRRKKSLLTVVLYASIFFFFCQFIHNQTSLRTTQPTSVQKKDLAKTFAIPEKPLAKPQDKTTYTEALNRNAIPKSDREIWCEVKDYQDLSQDPIFAKFSHWLGEYSALNCPTIENCQDHDPRMLAHFIGQGKSLARTRAKILKNIIRADPQKALQLAIPEEVIHRLPSEVSLYMEKWESGFVDITCIYHCFDTSTNGGWLMRHAHFDDGRKLRAWTFGKHKRLISTEGIAVWGISLEEDFAVSDNFYRVEEQPSGQGKLWFAGGDVAYESSFEKEFIIQTLQPSFRNVGGVRRARYPVILASGSSIYDLYDQKYDINTSRVTFDVAFATAIEKNASLLRIDNENENKLILKLLQKKLEELEQVELLQGFNEDNSSNTLVWLGATDNDDQNGTRFDNVNNVTVGDVDINASEGNWRWINGEDENISYSNWKWGDPPDSNDSKDYAALDWNTSGATWIDINETARLPFIIEKNFELGLQDTNLMGVRKVLVIPARFVDETTAYKSALEGSNNPLTNELGENILDELQMDSYEPISREKIDQAMKEVNEFFLRNTDGQLDLVPVVSPTVTLPLFRYRPDFTVTGSNPYDSEGTLSGIQEIRDGDSTRTWDGGTEERTALGSDPLETPYAIDFQALGKAAALGEEWNIESYAFQGVTSVSITGDFTNNPFPRPPNVQINGGEVLLENGSTHPRFRPAEVEAIINPAGYIEDFKVIDPGAYYDTEQNVTLVINGQDFSTEVSVMRGEILVSYVILSNYSGGAAGLGWVGKKVHMSCSLKALFLQAPSSMKSDIILGFFMQKDTLQKAN